jgi:hypothetical protein
LAAKTSPRWLVVRVLGAIALMIAGIILYLGHMGKPWWEGARDKEFWDYLELLIVPAALAIGVYLLDRAQSERDRKAVEAQQQRESDAERTRREYELDVAKRRAENEYRKEFVMHILRAYNGAKKVRRVLAAHRSDDKKIPCSVYEAQMEALMDSQLELELYKPEKKVRPEKVGAPNALLALLPFENEKTRGAISALMSELERYLNNIIEDYDKGDKGRYAEMKKKLGLNGPSSQMPLQCLPALQQFVETGTFKPEFALLVDKLVKQIKEENERAHSNEAK